MSAANVTASMRCERSVHSTDLCLGHSPGLDLAVGSLLGRRPSADLAADGRVGAGVPEGVRGAGASLPDAVIAGGTGLLGVIGVGIAEEIADGRVESVAGGISLSVRAGIVAGFGGAGAQGCEVSETADFQGGGARDGAFQGQRVAVDQGDIAVRITTGEIAFQLGVFGRRGIANAVALGLADKHGPTSNITETLTRCGCA